MDNRQLGNPGTAAFQVERYPFFVLNRLVSRYNAVIGARLRTIELDIPSWRVLMILGERSPLGVRDIADRAVIPLSTMTRIVQRMAGAGLVRLADSAADARVTQVTLSAAGRGRLVEARAATAPIYERVIRGLTEHDFDQMLGILALLYENLGSAEQAVGSGDDR